MEQERAELMNWNYPIEVATAQRFSPIIIISRPVSIAILMRKLLTYKLHAVYKLNHN